MGAWPQLHSLGQGQTLRSGCRFAIGDSRFALPAFAAAEPAALVTSEFAVAPQSRRVVRPSGASLDSAYSHTDLEAAY